MIPLLLALLSPTALAAKPAHGAHPKPQKPQAIVIGRMPEPTTGFQFVPLSRGKLKLTFVSRDPNVFWDRNAPFLIQILPKAPLQVKPSLFTGSEWPKNKWDTTLGYSGAARGKPALVAGKASYLVCKNGAKTCTRTMRTFELKFSP